MTKAPLKMYAVFNTIRSIFKRNPDVVEGSKSNKEKAWKLMMKIVNSFSVKMEMGNPMICMYILGNPDHYKSHNFQVFYWISFINAARRPWVGMNTHRCKEETEEDGTLLDSKVVQHKQSDMEVFNRNDEFKEKVTILKYNNRFIGLSSVHDYIHQCKALHDMCLYDWIARCEQIKIPKKLILNRSKKDEDDGQGVTEGESSVDECSSSHPNFCISETKSNMFPLLLEHPLTETHGTQCCPVRKEKVLNFVGSTLPRYDQGDCKYYCSVILTLFKPWQSGLELKTQEQSWDDAFSTHKFSAKHQYIMRNLNI